MVAIKNEGWELFIHRVEEQEKHGAPRRTYGSYQLFIDGEPVAGMSGHMCERQGPGDNTKVGKDAHARVAEGRYPVSTQFGTRYVSVGYEKGEEHPMPGILLKGTNKRTGILIHPAHKDVRYISSIGCLNPTRDIGKHTDIDFDDSQKRVIALIDSLKAHDAHAFASENNTRVKDAFVVIDGEPH